MLTDAALKSLKSKDKPYKVTDRDGMYVRVGTVEHAGHLPARVAGAITRDLLHRFDEFVIVNPPIVGAGHGAKLQPSIVGFERLDLLGPIGSEAVLQIDRGKRRRKLTQIGGCSPPKHQTETRPTLRKPTPRVVPNVLTTDTQTNVVRQSTTV